MGERNDERAQWAHTALDAFPALAGDVDDARDLHQNVKDLVCDLGHLLHQVAHYTVDEVAGVLEAAIECFEEEVHDDE